MDGRGGADEANGKGKGKGKAKGNGSVSASPRQGMIWDGFQWHAAPTAAEAEEYRAQKVPVTQLKQMAQAQALAQAQAQAQAQAASAQTAAALQMVSAQLKTKYPPNPLNACPLVNPEIAAACAAAAAAAGKLTPQQATILQLAGKDENGVETQSVAQAQMGLGVQTNPSLTAQMLSNDAVQKQMNKFFPGLVKEHKAE